MLRNPYLLALLGALVGGLTVAGPLVDDGVLASEAIAITLGALTGSGLVSLPNARQRRGEFVVVPGHEDEFPH